MTNPPSFAERMRLAKVAKAKAKARVSGKAHAGSSAAKRRNPVPGLAVAVIGNPPKKTKDSVMAKSRTRKRRHSARAVAKPAPAAKHRRTGKRTSKRSGARKSAPLALVVTGSKLKSRSVRRNPGRLARLRSMGGKLAGGLMADFKGLTDLGKDFKSPKTWIWMGIGASGTAVGGAWAAWGLAKMLPAKLAANPMVARGATVVSYGAVAVIGTRFIKDTANRRRALAGGLAVAVAEGLWPGVTAKPLSVIPGIKAVMPKLGIAPPAPIVAPKHGLKDDLASDLTDALNNISMNHIGVNEPLHPGMGDLSLSLNLPPLPPVMTTPSTVVSSL